MMVSSFTARMVTGAEAPAGGSVPQFGRVQIEVPAGSTAVEFTTPDGSSERAAVFMHQPARFTYDQHGWETLTAAGGAVSVVRFTPTKVGMYRWKVVSGDASGAFTCTASEHPGYVQISSRDPRYFATTDGKPYVAIGLNACWPPGYSMPAGGEFKTSGQTGYMGVRDYERWFDRLRENGGNFVRLWIGAGYFAHQKAEMGQIDPLLIARLDAVVEAARARGIRLKISIDSFRRIQNAPGDFQALMPVDPATGKSPADVSEFLDSPRWRELWLQKVEHYVARYGGDPTVAVIEPWNEMNCVQAPWEKTLAWNAYVLPELKKRFPRQLVVNSLGSFDSDWSLKHYTDLRELASQEFDQVHRYLDQGARYKECHEAVLGSIDAIRRTAQKHRPVLLAETGAVNNNHTGLFRFYRWDDRGIIFHDTTFPAFFAGSAGTGHEWHWESYVDQKNCWPQYKALADLIEGVAIDQEQFVTQDLSTEKLWCLALVGQKHTLLWLRNRSDTWMASLRDRQEVVPVENVEITLPKAGRVDNVTSCWAEAVEAVRVDGVRLSAPMVRAGMMVRVVH